MKTTPLFTVALVLAAILPAQAIQAQAQQDRVQDSHTIIRSESRLVLVDSVVTDKKGGYIHGLTEKDFKVWQDGKEQTISSFSFQADAASDTSRRRYIVLFFDNTTVSMANQAFARQAAVKFIEANAGPNRMMSVIEFGPALRVAQNFTEDVDRLKKAVSGVKYAGGAAADNSGVNSRSFTNYSTRNVLGALRDMAKGLTQVPGRKTLVLFSEGFRLNGDNLTDLNSTIDACNHANVAIYPIDVHGLAGPAMGTVGPFGLLQTPLLKVATLASPLAFLQGRGGGGSASGGSSAGGTAGGGATSTGGGVAAGGGGSTGTRGPANPGAGTNPGTGAGGNQSTGGRPTAPGQNAGQNPGQNNQGGRNGLGNTPMDPFDRSRASQNSRFRQLIPLVDNNVGGQEQVLCALASGTGGFVLAHTNDLLGGMQKISKEQDEYYVLGYVPSKESEPGACHTLKVRVEKSGTNVRFRTGYCDAKGVDMLSGTPTQRELEARITANATPTVKASMQAPFFFIAPNTARVSVAVDMPGDSLHFTKEKGKFQLKLNVVGIAYLPDGGISARFSDSVKLTLEDRKQVEAWMAKPFHYEKQFEMASGSYLLKVVFSSSADSFGRLETPLLLDEWEPGKFLLSSLALSKSARPATGVGVGIDAELLDERVPLIVSGNQVIPAGTSHFLKADKCFIYAEIYEPALAVPDQKDIPVVGIQMQVLDGQSDKVLQDSRMVQVKTPAATGNPVVPVGLTIPIAALAAGPYSIRIKAADALGHEFTRTVRFEVE